jgi:hypothetical protein
MTIRAGSTIAIPAAHRNGTFSLSNLSVPDSAKLKWHKNQVASGLNSVDCSQPGLDRDFSPKMSRLKL